MAPAPVPPDDDALLIRARSGDSSAVAALYALHHAQALRLAQSLTGQNDGEDLLSDAFARVVAQLQAGAGPRTSFRGYLHTAIRNRHRDLRRRAAEEPVSHQPWVLEETVTITGGAPRGPADDHAAAALATLPESWQRVLRLVEIEGVGVTRVAEQLDLKPAEVSSLAYRAREGLRTAYLEQLIGRTTTTSTECAWVRARLGRYVRAGLSARAGSRIESHLVGCSACGTLLRELDGVNRRFRFGRVATEPLEVRHGSAGADPHPVRHDARPARASFAAR